MTGGRLTDLTAGVVTELLTSQGVGRHPVLAGFYDLNLNAAQFYDVWAADDPARLMRLMTRAR